MSNNHIKQREREGEKKASTTEQRVPVMAIQQIK